MISSDVARDRRRNRYRIRNKKQNQNQIENTDTEEEGDRGRNPPYCPKINVRGLSRGQKVFASNIQKSSRPSGTDNNIMEGAQKMNETKKELERLRRRARRLGLWIRKDRTTDLYYMVCARLNAVCSPFLALEDLEEYIQREEENEK